MRTTALIFAAVLLLISGAGVDAAESYPARPIRLVVPSGAGGITDILARIIAQKVTDNLGQQVVVDNRPGASGIVGSQIVAKATPDGYTLLMVFPSHPVNPSLVPKMPYDTVRAFAPITMVSAVSSVLIVGADSPAKSARDLIAMARERPGRMNFGSVGRGSLGHLSAELLRSMTGVNITHVSYKGSPQVLSALLAGEINLYFIASAGTVVPLAKAGRVRPLAVTTKERLPILPEVPPVAEAVPGYEARGTNGILAPAGTPRAVINRLHREIVRIVRSPEFVEQLTAQGATPVGSTPPEFGAAIRADIEKWAKVIKEAGIRAY
ncbi:MAG: tripartite tricarboxylate transporter substrate binding protein [Betaproteobacteria bacterium]|nr:tripartite tricarboxylate transporter substrate binding protein [Betaproteobacteria bacterium]